MQMDENIKKDFERLAALTGTASFAYEELHNENVNNYSHYDYEKVINAVSKAKNISYDEARNRLIDAGVLRYLADGDFAIDVGSSTRSGGGINYRGGLIQFCHSQRDAQVLYHEYAHSLQSMYHPFNDDVLNKMYNDSFMDMKKNTYMSQDYYRYLNEMHSETFAYTIMLMRAKSTKEFMDIAAEALSYGASMTINGSKEKQTIYGQSGANSKYYATYNVMKETIKTVLKLKRKQKYKDYFDENGAIKPQEMCNLARDIVQKSAYSPRQFRAFMAHRMMTMPFKKTEIKANISDRPITRLGMDHSYRRDVVGSYLAKGLLDVYEKIRGFNKEKFLFNANLRHSGLISDHTKKLKTEFLSPIDTSLPKNALALQSIDKIHLGLSMFDQSTHMEDFTEELLRAAVAKRYRNKDFSEESRRKFVDDCCCALGHHPLSATSQLLDEFFKRTDEISQINADNPYFDKMMSYSEHTLYQQIEAKNTLAYEPDNFSYAPKIGKMSILNKMDDIDRIGAFIRLGIDVNSATHDGLTPLMYSRDPIKTKMLLDAGANPNAQDAYGQTPVMYARTAEMVQLYIDAKANLEIKDAYGYTALFNCNRSSVLRALIDGGADKNARDNNGRTVLMHDKSISFMKTFLTEGPKPDINAVDSYGKNALVYHLANPQITKLLIDAGIDVNAQDNYGNTALIYSSDKNTIKTILEAKPDLNIRNIYGENALMHNMSYEKTKLLIDAGIDINACDNMNKNALMHVLADPNLEGPERLKIVDKMLKSGIDTKVNDENGSNALSYLMLNHTISYEDKSKLIERLVYAGVDYKQVLNDNIFINLDEKKQIVDVLQSMREKASKLSIARNRVAKAIDRLDSRIGSPIQKIIGKKVEDIQLPRTLKTIESKISYGLFKRSNTK